MNDHRLRALGFAGVLAITTGCPRPRPYDPSRAERPETGPSAQPEVVSLLGRPLYAIAPGAQRDKLEADLAAARADLALDPDNADKLIWVGRRLGYLWRMKEAIAVYSAAIASHPDDARLYRHRGHRYISIRQFEKAIADLERAAQLIADRPDQIEPDGQPNARNLPLTSLAFNVWYHLGVARYCKGDFAGALRAFRETANFTRGYDDNLVAVTDWSYMTLRRLGRETEALALLTPISAAMDIIENRAYHRRLLMYKGLIEPDKLMDGDDLNPTDRATLGYGLGNGYLYDGDVDRAADVLGRVVTGEAWPAFGFIAAEADLTRLPPH